MVTGLGVGYYSMTVWIIVLLRRLSLCARYIRSFVVVHSECLRAFNERPATSCRRMYDAGRGIYRR